MPTYVTPGVYTRETNISQTPQGTAPGSCALVGGARRGPNDEPVLLTDVQDAITIFGEPDASGSHGHALHSALMALTQSNVVWFRRVTGTNAQHSAVVLRPDPDNPTDIDDIPSGNNIVGEQSEYDGEAGGLLVYAANPGTWGNSLRVEFANYRADGARAAGEEVETVEINVLEERNGVNEQQENFTVSLTPGATNVLGNRSVFIEDVVNEESNLIRVVLNRENVQDTGLSHDIREGSDNADGSDDNLLIGSSSAIPEGTISSDRPIVVGDNSFGLDIMHDTEDVVVVPLVAGEPVDGVVSLSSASSFTVDSNTFYIREFTVNLNTGVVVGPTFNNDSAGLSGTLTNLPANTQITLSYWQRFVLNLRMENEAFEAEVLRTPVPLRQGNDVHPTNDNVIAAWDDFNERDQIQVRHLVQGGEWAPSNNEQTLEGNIKSLQSKLISIAQSRRDCMAILDPPSTMLAATDLRDWVNGENGPEASSFAEVHAPQQMINDPFSGRRYAIPLSGTVAAIHALTHRDRNAWIAPAGPNRGGVQSGQLQFLRLTNTYTVGEQTLLNAAQVNLFATAPGFGTNLMGQYTRLRDGSALSRINVRYLVIETESAMRDFLQNFLFEQNTETLRLLISGRLNTYFRGIQAADGISDYLVQCDERNNTPERVDANELHVLVLFQPVRSVEYIVYNTVVTSTGVDLQQTASTTSP